MLPLLLASLLTLASTGAVLPPGPPHELPDPLAQAMHAAALQDFPAALQLIRSVESDSPPVIRERDFCLALVLLSAPPITPGRTNEAAALFQRVREADPADDLGIAALFYLARIEQTHRSPPNLDEAARRFEQLANSHPDNWFGQFAILKLASLELNRADRSKPGVERVDYWLRRGESITDPVLLRNFCWTMGDAVIRHGGSLERALEIYQKGEAIGYSRFDIRALMIVRIHNLAYELGRTDLAIEAAQRYIDEHSRSTIVQFFRDRLRELAATEEERSQL
ncbi:MAG: hypothetical protein EA425_08655 [Puniceicoccaceae bacterium]|nr:MAG: hypothetical protein EA425_08655 [Puniceicoccaceae bacterium]